MIAFEPCEVPAVRPGELDLCGRRVAARALPYVWRNAPGGMTFDAVDRRFVRRRDDAPVAAGPARPEDWREAVRRLPRGPVLVGPGDEAGERVWGAFLAAAAGAAGAGRPVYLIDPPMEGIPKPRADELVAFFTWSPAHDVHRRVLHACRAREIPAGILLPLLPGWTAEPGALEDFVRSAAEAGARFLAPLLPDDDGAGRRAIVEARASVEPDAADAYFGRIHHADWPGELARAERLFKALCAQHGLASVPPRPVGRGEPAGNAAAASLLENRAAETEESEHRATMLHAAARWIDESGRDLSTIAREGNFRKVFPFDGELAREAEEALLRFGS